MLIIAEARNESNTAQPCADCGWAFAVNLLDDDNLCAVCELRSYNEGIRQRRLRAEEEQDSHFRLRRLELEERLDTYTLGGRGGYAPKATKPGPDDAPIGEPLSAFKVSMAEVDARPSPMTTTPVGRRLESIRRLSTPSS